VRGVIRLQTLLGSRAREVQKEWRVWWVWRFARRGGVVVVERCGTHSAAVHANKYPLRFC